MLPIGPLMIEHRLIEKMIGLIQRRADRYAREGDIDPVFIDSVIDFMRTYADRCHHGKEEEILFRELNKKVLPPELKHILDQLVEEHRQGRQTVADLVEARQEYARGDREAVRTILDRLRYMTDLYPRHIEKEDGHFFIPCMSLFTQEENEEMLNEENAFDRELVHQIYREKISAWSKESDGEEDTRDTREKGL
ncbi:MAG TPA: hemerythrin domain-containing protein [Syntrophorhabdaceae bacterium]|nr:hemerythrin domain-containing protein [Syntrophorhabdaceae bacterium]